MARDLEKLWQAVRQIPEGSCAAYSDLGRALDPPVSGYTVGKWMAQAPHGVPWWRVVAKDGSLPIAKKSPELALLQRRLLEDEGVAFVGGRADLEGRRHFFVD